MELGRRVLVTGGAGFIGSNLVRRLVSLGHHVGVIDAMTDGSGAHPYNLADVEGGLDSRVEADLAVGGSWESAVDGVDMVFHLAAQIGHGESMRHPLVDLEANATATLRLLETIRDRAPGAGVVFTSTRQVYGRPLRQPVDEDHPTNPPDVNAVHNLAAEQYLRVYAQVYGVRSTILRLTNTYGPRMRVRDARQTFVGLWARLAVQGEGIVVFGDGAQRRDLTFVDDAVEALLAAAEMTSIEVPTFNIGGASTRLVDLAEVIVRLAGHGSYRLEPFPEERKRIDIGDFEIDDSAFRAATGWSPHVDLEDGVRRTLQYYRVEGHRYW